MCGLRGGAPLAVPPAGRAAGAQRLRLFVAIVPPAAAVDDLEAAAAPLRPAWPQLRWTGHDAWHITLAFLGQVSEVTAERLLPRLERVAGRHPGLRLAFGGAGAFPSRVKARVVWAGIRGDRDGLAALAASAAAGARRAGAAPPEEGRRFRGHLTLARCREPADVRPLVDELTPYSGAPWRASDIHLVRSHLDPAARARYEVLASWPLRGGPPSAGHED